MGHPYPDPKRVLILRTPYEQKTLFAVFLYMNLSKSYICPLKIMGNIMEMY